MSRSARQLEVHLHGRRVGILEQLDGGVIGFHFSSDYWRLPGRPTLGQWFEDGPEDALQTGHRGRLPPYFANLEPEGAVRRWLAQQHDVADGPLDLLAAVGFDLPGAVQLLPVQQPAAAARHVVARAPAAARHAWSVPGAQLKLPMSLDREDRLTLTPAGEMATLLLKIPPEKRYRGLVENEHATMTWARRAGFRVPRTWTADAGTEVGEWELPRASLVIERFDRPAGQPSVHQEDFCQILALDPDQRFPLSLRGEVRLDEPSEQRRAVATTLEGLGRVVERVLGVEGDVEGVEEYLRRVVFIIASGNGDAHLKNWAIEYPDQRNPRWSPLYDQVATVVWNDETLCLPLFGSRSYAKIHRTDLIRLGEHCGLSGARAGEIIDATVDRLSEAWVPAQAEAPYPHHHRDVLVHHWRKRVPLLRARGGLPAVG